MADKRLPLVIELGTEELPPKALDDLAGAFARGVVEGLEKRGVAGDYASAKAYASPRRLAVHIAAVAVAQPEQTIERRGPAVAASIGADGEPSKAWSALRSPAASTSRRWKSSRPTRVPGSSSGP